MNLRVKLECPTNFLEPHEVESILLSREMCLNSEDPDAVVVNPGTDKYLCWDYFGGYKNLSVVGTPSTGTNHINVSALTSRGISVVCLLDDKKSLNDIHASAEFTWVHIMNLTRKFTNAIASVDDWRSETNELLLRSNELHGKTIGIIGMGRIGIKLASYAKAFGMNVCFYDPYKKSWEFPAIKKVQELSDMSVCDILSINCTLTKETNSLIRPGVWDDLKPGTVVVNTSRGDVVDEDYIVSLVNNNGIYYGTDVLQNEQNLRLLKKSSLYELSKRSDRVVITPHVAGATKESQTKALVTTLDLVKSAV